MIDAYLAGDVPTAVAWGRQRLAAAKRTGSGPTG